MDAIQSPVELVALVKLVLVELALVRQQLALLLEPLVETQIMDAVSH